MNFSGRFDRFSNSVTDSKKGVDYRLSKKPIFFNKHTLLFDLSEELLLSLERFRRHHFRTKCLRTYTKYVTEGNQLDDESGGLSYWSEKWHRTKAAGPSPNEVLVCTSLRVNALNSFYSFQVLYFPDFHFISPCNFVVQQFISFLPI